MITLLLLDEGELGAAVEAVLRRRRAAGGRLLVIADGPAGDAIARAVRAASCCPPELVQFVRPAPGSLDGGLAALFRGLHALVLPFVGGPTSLIVWIACLLDARGLAACGGIAGFERGLARHVEPLAAELISAHWVAGVRPSPGSRGAASAIRLVLRDVDLNELAVAALRLAGEELSARGIVPEVALAEVPLRGRFDPARMRQVLLALLVDAIASDPSPGGALRVRTRRGEGGRIAILAVERGGGRSAEVAVARLSRPVFLGRSDEVGVGLLASRRIVAAHGGSIHAESREDGLRLIVVLPLRG